MQMATHKQAAQSIKGLLHYTTLGCKGMGPEVAMDTGIDNA